MHLDGLKTIRIISKLKSQSMEIISVLLMIHNTGKITKRTQVLLRVILLAYMVIQFLMRYLPHPDCSEMLKDCMVE